VIDQLVLELVHNLAYEIVDAAARDVLDLSTPDAHQVVVMSDRPEAISEAFALHWYSADHPDFLEVLKCSIHRRAAGFGDRATQILGGEVTAPFGHGPHDRLSRDSRSPEAAFGFVEEFRLASHRC
jgi:hypothetical protein